MVEAGPERGRTQIPRHHKLPPDGLNIRPHDDRFAQEERLHARKIPAVLAFARANALNAIVMQGGKSPKIGIVAAGKHLGM